MTATPLLFRWRDAVASAHGPDSPTTRFVLVFLSLDADQDGGSCFPSTRRLATRTGLSRTCVMSHLDSAEEDGWIRRRPVGTDRGQGWRRSVYDLLIPPEVVNDVDHDTGKVVNEVDHVGGQRGLPGSGEGGQPHEQGGQPDGVKVVNEVDLTSPVTSPKTSPPPPEGESADADPDRMGADELVATWINALGSRPAGVSKQAAVAKRLTKAYDRTTIIRAVDGIQQLFPHSDGEPWDLFDLEKKFTKATTARRNGREGTTQQAELDEDDLAAWNPISGDKATRRRGRPS